MSQSSRVLGADSELGPRRSGPTGPSGSGTWHQVLPLSTFSMAESETPYPRARTWPGTPARYAARIAGMSAARSRAWGWASPEGAGGGVGSHIRPSFDVPFGAQRRLSA